MLPIIQRDYSEPWLFVFPLNNLVPDKAHLGDLFVTTSKFSKQAIEYAAKQHIILIDGEKLTGYMIEYNFGVSEKKIFTIKGIDTDTFNDYVDGW